MIRLVKPAVLATALALPAGLVLAQEEGESPESIALEIRHGHMLNMAHNLMTLGGMAKGDVEYDSATAQAAADNLNDLAQIHWDYYWPEGTAQGQIEDSAALPAIWEKMDDFEAKRQGLQDAVAKLQSAAGTDLASLQGAMQGVGQACGACHELYRAKEEGGE